MNNTSTITLLTPQAPSKIDLTQWIEQPIVHPQAQPKSACQPARTLTFAYAQLNPVINDFKTNGAQIIESARQAHALGAKVVVFPELSVCGYHPGDHLLDPSFSKHLQQCLSALLDASVGTPGCVWIVGAPTPSGSRFKPYYNSLLAILDGKIVGTYHKQLLPTYNVFDEQRHFLPGPAQPFVLNIQGFHVGFVVCEDAWNKESPLAAVAHYGVDPIEQLQQCSEHLDMVCSINASPSNLFKHAERQKLISAISAHLQVPFLYVNQVGGFDGLIYDGASFLTDAAGSLIWQGAFFDPQLCVLRMSLTDGTERLDTQSSPLKASTTSHQLPQECAALLQAAVAHTHSAHLFELIDQTLLPHIASEAPSVLSTHSTNVHLLTPIAPPHLDSMELMYQHTLLGLSDYLRKCGFSKVVVGCSGGIDSALTLALSAKAIGPQNVLAVTMPSAVSSTHSITDSQTLCSNLGIQLIEHPIASIVDAHLGAYTQATGSALEGVAYQNVQARVRGTILMQYSNAQGHLLLTTGNKSEVSVGYATLYGDTNGGLSLIGDIYKTQVFELARYFNQKHPDTPIPMSIIQKAPSAELAPNQLDTDNLPPYEVLDPILMYLIEAHALPMTVRKMLMHYCQQLCQTPQGQALFDRVRKMLFTAEYKRKQSAPIIRIQPLAFGAGRQVPISARYFD